MKDIVITKKRQKTELLSILVCFIIAFGLNLYAVIAYDGKWTEIFTCVGFMIMTTAVFYVLWTLLRLIVYLIKKTIAKS